MAARRGCNSRSSSPGLSAQSGAVPGRIGYQKNGRDITTNTDDVYDLRGKTSEETPLDTSITRVPAGSVGVVRSSVQIKGADCHARTAVTDNGGLAAELVTSQLQGRVGDFAAAQRLLPQPRRL